MTTWSSRRQSKLVWLACFVNFVAGKSKLGRVGSLVYLSISDVTYFIHIGLTSYHRKIIPKEFLV